MSPATTPEPKTWGRDRVSAVELNREVRDQLRDLQTRVNALTGGGGGSLFPTGAVVAIGTSTVPSGWLLCDGRTVPIDDYTALHTAIGSAYNTGGEAASEFRLPKLNDAIPRMGATSSGDGALNNRGIGAGSNTRTLDAHPANLDTNPAANLQSGYASVNHTHGTNSIHAGGTHSFVHNHGVNQNTGAHNHASGHNHNLGVVGVAVNRNTGTRIMPVGHNHSCDAVNIDSSSDGAHNHAFTSNASTSAQNYTSNDTANRGIETWVVSNPPLVETNLHTHNMAHSHSWGSVHSTLSMVPASVSVNYIIKA